MTATGLYPKVIGFSETEHEVVDFTGTPTLSHIKAMQSWISAMHVLLRGVSLLSVQVTRWGEWRVRSAGCAAGSLEIRRAGGLSQSGKWGMPQKATTLNEENDDSDSDRGCFGPLWKKS